MIVFNLLCADEHGFEGWFASSEAFERQLAVGQVSCPLCGDANIRKALSAPRLNLGARPSALSAASAEASKAYLGSQAMLMQQFKRFILSHTENVGTEFADTARRMHYGEETHRNIRGKVSIEEAALLQEEGIPAVNLPVELVLDETVQ